MVWCTRMWRRKGAADRTRAEVDRQSMEKSRSCVATAGVHRHGHCRCLDNRRKRPHQTISGNGETFTVISFGQFYIAALFPPNYFCQIQNSNDNLFRLANDFRQVEHIWMISHNCNNWVMILQPRQPKWSSRIPTSIRVVQLTWRKTAMIQRAILKRCYDWCSIDFLCSLTIFHSIEHITFL